MAVPTALTGPLPLVGDVIMDMRSAGPDLPQAQGPPTLTTLTPTTGGSIAADTYFIEITSLMTWGETTPSAEQSVVIGGGNNAIGITFTPAPNSTGARVYIGLATGEENFFVEFSSDQFPITVTTFANQQPGGPPVRSTAYLPDTDGGFVSAYVAYRWLNEALQKASIITGGIQDWGGAGSVANQPMYRPAAGVWRKFDACWYDGWELEQGNKAEIFRNKPITASISRIFAMDVNGAGQVMELYYIPSRTGAQTLTAAPFFPDDSTVTLASTAGFTGPPFGLVLIGTEVCFYAQVLGNQLTGLTRGLSGTVTPSATVPSPVAVTELNILWNGFRMPAHYSSGQSLTTLNVPQGWASILTKYMLAKFRDAEQSRQEAASLFKEFEVEFKTLAYSNRQLAGPRQARIFDSFGFRGVVPASAGGGLIIR